MAQAAHFRLPCVLLLAGMLACALPSSAAPPATATYAGLILHCRITNSFTIPAGKTWGGLCQMQGVLPNAAEYGVDVRAVVYAQAGGSDTTCLVKLAGGAVYATPVTVPANTSISVPFEDTGPGFPGQTRTPAIVITAGAGGPLTILAGTTITLEAIASQPGNNAY